MKAESIFNGIIRWRWLVIAATAILFGALAANAPKLQKDTSADAFIDPLSPALVNRDRIEDIFNINDPIVVAVVNDGPEGIFNVDSLQLVSWLTRELQQIDNIDPDQITSLATQSNIVGTDDGMDVEDFFEQAPTETTRIHWLKNAVEQFPLYQGSLVAKNTQATLVVAELIDESIADETYEEILALVEQAPHSEQDQIHVAGEGAVAGYLATYIDNDARKLNPTAALIITIILFLAFRTLRGTLLPNLIVLLTAGSTLGAMAAFGVSFFVITNGLIVCMIGIAVADSVHVFSQYYEEIALDPSANGKTITARAMSKMWLPITLTTFTTAAGFGALSLTTSMPPIYYFGIFGALSVLLAWTYTMTILPSILSMLRPKASPSFKTKGTANNGNGTHHQPDSGSSRWLEKFGHLVLNRPRTSVTIGLALTFMAAYGSYLVETNEERIANFKSNEAIYIADHTINEHMDGTYTLDVLIETPSLEDIYDPAVLKKIEQAQLFLETLPQVGGSTSVVDYIKQMHKAVNENQQAYYTIPNNKQLIAQLFLLYSASGDPTDFEDEIDGERRLALIRVNVNENKYSNNVVLVSTAQAWLDQHFSGTSIKATLGGDINVSYHWIDNIANSNLYSIITCAIAVLVMAALLFRSLTAGILSLLPVALSIVLVYAVMGFSGIWLGVGTSMFASIAIGLGVDFAVHTTHSMRELIGNGEGSWEQRLAKLYPTTGRAQLFNFLAIALGFSALLTSDVPPLIKFGGLVAVAVTTAFIAALVLIPALAVIFQPQFFKKRLVDKKGLEKNTKQNFVGEKT